jgi:hypothetical protein
VLLDPAHFTGYVARRPWVALHGCAALLTLRPAMRYVTSAFKQALELVVAVIEGKILFTDNFLVAFSVPGPSINCECRVFLQGVR